MVHVPANGNTSRAVASDDSIHAIIIHGEGKAFAAGTDIQQFQGFSGEDGVAYEHTMEAIVERLYTISKPTIAAIHGYAVGAGLVIAAVCDLRYATPASRFGVPIARTLGNCITLKNYRHLVDAFGAMRTKEMLFTARLLTTTDALQCGFLTATVEEETLIHTCDRGRPADKRSCASHHLVGEGGAAPFGCRHRTERFRRRCRPYLQQCRLRRRSSRVFGEAQTAMERAMR